MRPIVKYDRTPEGRDGHYADKLDSGHWCCGLAGWNVRGRWSGSGSSVWVTVAEYYHGALWVKKNKGKDIHRDVTAPFIGEINQMIIVCNGMLRAGSTLQYNLACSLLEKYSLCSREGFYTSNQIDNLKESMSKWEEEDVFHVLKTHELHPFFKKRAPSGRIRFLYIYRDIRDVAVSVKLKFKRTDKEMIREIDCAVAVFNELCSTEGVLWQKYEEVVGDLSSAVRSQAAFLGLEPSEDMVHQVVEECSMSEAKRSTASLPMVAMRFVQQSLQKVGVRFAYYNKHSLFHPNHISKNRGASGIWQQELAEEEIAMLTERYRVWLQKAGYSV